MPTDPEPDDEAAWVRAAARGDEEAFLRLVERYEPRVFSLAAKFGRDRAETQDLAQEIFVTLWQSLPGFRGRAPFEHWLTRVAMNRCKRFLRGVRRRRQTEILEEEIRDGTTGDPAVESREAREILALALRRLSPGDALLLTLKEVEERSLSEIAELVGSSEGAIKVQAHRARRRLREELEKMGELPATTSNRGMD